MSSPSPLEYLRTWFGTEQLGGVLPPVDDLASSPDGCYGMGTARTSAPIPMMPHGTPPISSRVADDGSGRTPMEGGMPGPDGTSPGESPQPHPRPPPTHVELMFLDSVMSDSFFPALQGDGGSGGKHSTPTTTWM